MNGKFVLRTLIAAFIGEIALLFFATVSHQVLLGSQKIGVPPTKDIFIGASASLISAMLAGMVASAIGGKHNKWPHLIISVFILAEVLFPFLSGKVHGFNLHLILVQTPIVILAVWIGFFAYRRIKG